MTSAPDPGAAPPERPAIDFTRNIREWHDEVDDRIERMVAWSLRTDRPVAEHHLRKLGPDGRAAFGRALNRALDRKVRETTAAADEPAATVEPPERTDPAGPVLPEVDWADRRCPRASPDLRTWGWGWMCAAFLTAVAAVWLSQLVSR